MLEAYETKIANNEKKTKQLNMCPLFTDMMRTVNATLEGGFANMSVLQQISLLVEWDAILGVFMH